MSHAVVVLDAHVADIKARVLGLSTSEPRVLVMCGFIVSIHGLVFLVTTTVYSSFVQLGCWSGIPAS
jgi:hypothetical protein